MWDNTQDKYNYNSEWNPPVEAIRRKFRTARISYGKNNIQRKLRTAKFRTVKYPYDEISVRRKFGMAKNPYGKKSYDEKSYGKNSYGKNFGHEGHHSDKVVEFAW